MKRLYSRDKLFKLRNDIRIDVLISQSLLLPNKISEGYFRFLCPVCREFNTATNPKTNLARCFCCNRNYNPIDMVMVCKQMRFIQAVKYLEDYWKSLSADLCETKQPPDRSGQPKMPAPIGEILQSIVKDNRKLPTNSGNTGSGSDNQFVNRIDQLESRLELLLHRLESLESEIRKFSPIIHT